ncbi:MAG: pyrroline-5-carboxylate reductase [Clostridia bacterium]|nr:pyrroline-5-carboxylate reductase [Clostridia bacterium]
MFDLGFIGCGNMGGALVRAAARGGARIALHDIDEEKVNALCAQTGAMAVSLEFLMQESRYVVLGVKPHQVMDMCAQLQPMVRPGQVFVSMAAGVDVGRIETALKEAAVIRIMPNTPCAVGAGMITYCLGAHCPRVAAEEFLRLMAAAGAFDEIAEHLIDAASAVAGCGPAFAAMFMEALADGGVQCGLPRKKALQYAQQMLLGTAKLAIEGGEHPGQMKDNVCSPGGSTIAGVAKLEEKGFRGAVMQAVCAADARNKELGK